MTIIESKTVQEAARVITDLLTSYHADIDRALQSSEAGKVKVSMGVLFTVDEAKVSFSFVGEKISITSTMKNVQGELELPKPDKVYRMGATQ